MSTRRRIIHAGLGLTLAAALGVSGCGDDDDEGDGSGGTGARPDNTGAACETPDDCYPNVGGGEGSTIAGEVQCLDRIDEGYCTHLCTSDADCCAVEGECEEGYTQVCSPFESTGLMMCFISCEPDQLGGLDEATYCHDKASPDFICRSSGGGANNRKICVPGDCGVGESCAADADCAAGLTCITSLEGGYCGVQDCTINADCPADSLCVKHGDGKNYCFRTCAADVDCQFCRTNDALATCVDDAVFAVDGTVGSVCVPQ